MRRKHGLVVGAAVFFVTIHTGRIVGHVRELVVELVTVEFSGAKPVCIRRMVVLALGCRGKQSRRAFRGQPAVVDGYREGAVARFPMHLTQPSQEGLVGESVVRLEK